MLWQTRTIKAIQLAKNCGFSSVRPYHILYIPEDKSQAHSLILYVQSSGARALEDFLFGVWDCLGWSSPLQGEIQMGSIPIYSTNIDGKIA